MKLAEYLIYRIRAAGAKTIFGIPGDFALPLFRTLDQLQTDVIAFTHEPSLGYAADAYARLNGFAAAFVTYGAGGLNMINAIAQAYAEKSPVLIVSGAPEILTRKRNLMVHHRVKTFESQKRIYDEICCECTIIERVADAAAEIDRVIAKILACNRPGYIEIPRDLAECDIPVPNNPHQAFPQPERANPLDTSVKTSLERIRSLVHNAQKPVLYVGVEVRRLKLEQKVLTLTEKSGIPFTTSMEGKAALPESHPHFVGTYMGNVGPESARRALEESDLVINLGAMMSDVNLGLFAGPVDPDRMLHLTADGSSYQGEAYANVDLATALDDLIHSAYNPAKKIPDSWKCRPCSHPPFGPITTDGVMCLVNTFVKKHKTAVILDVGDSLFASSKIQADILLGPSYYASMGFAVPAAIATAKRFPEYKPLVLVGDGSFQMTGAEIGTAKRYGLAPLVLVLNNSGFETMKRLDAPRALYNVPSCDFVKFAEAWNLKGARCESLEHLAKLLETHYEDKDAFLIEAVMTENSASETLQGMAKTVRR